MSVSGMYHVSQYPASRLLRGFSALVLVPDNWEFLTKRAAVFLRLDEALEEFNAGYWCQQAAKDAERALQLNPGELTLVRQVQQVRLHFVSDAETALPAQPAQSLGC